jgi:TatD DNase family protein
MTLFDSHCHLTDTRFGDDVGEVIDRARRAGVAGMVTIASHPADAAAAASLAGAHPDVWCTAGLHPHEAGRHGGDSLDELRGLLQHERIVAVGETGLDYHYDHAPRARQRASFAAQLDLAVELDLPVVVHSRAADADTIDLLRAVPGARGVLHCFSGGAALLEAGLAAGWYVSFAGLVSFRGYDGGDLLRAVPADRLLAETDSPYLAPVPRRGRRNEPAYVRHVVEAMAGLRGESPDELADRTTENALAFYRLPRPVGQGGGA